MQVKQNIYSGIIISLLIIGCQQTGNNSSFPSAQAVVDSAISTSNLASLEFAEASFDFRDRSYRYKRNKDHFEYSRLFRDSTGIETIDVLTNDGLIRQIAGQEQQLSEKKLSAYSNSVNSVIYFAFYLTDSMMRQQTKHI